MAGRRPVTAYEREEIDCWLTETLKGRHIVPAL